MKRHKSYRLIAIAFYLFIILKGQIIGVPFILWILFTLLDFGNTDQLFALLSTIGLIIIYINQNKARTRRIILVDVLCFILLASPLIRRMTAIPIEYFNYLSFIIPTTLFALFYTTSLVFSCIQHSRESARAN